MLVIGKGKVSLSRAKSSIPLELILVSTKKYHEEIRSISTSSWDFLNFKMAVVDFFNQ